MAQSVFLIHDSNDKPFARQLAVDFSLAGATVFLDESEIGGTLDTMVKYYVNAFHGDVFLAIILSPESVKTDWIQNEAELLMSQSIPGLSVKMLPILYKDCVVPSFMASKICADFRNPADYTHMLHQIIRSVEIGHNNNSVGSLKNLYGKWEGTWEWCGRKRDADMFLSGSSIIPSVMVIRYLKSGILTIVEQILDVCVSKNVVTLTGITYRLIEKGISLGWNLDTLNLTLDASNMTLEGINIDKRGVQSPVIIKRK